MASTLSSFVLINSNTLHLPFLSIQALCQIERRRLQERFFLQNTLKSSSLEAIANLREMDQFDYRIL
ncbi:hypothetical protein BVRB_1g016390 [Beta vulgaris subsp. vulgaris]|nr:hypothetical protein BVRB_1g016390 [Beta vulgaris subsp. vulgaris]